VRLYSCLLLIVNCAITGVQDCRPIGSYDDGPQHAPRRHPVEKEPDSFTFSSPGDRLTLCGCEQFRDSIRCTYDYINDTRLVRRLFAGGLYQNLALHDEEQRQYRRRAAFFIDPGNRLVPSVTLRPGEATLLVQEYGAAMRRPVEVLVFSNYPRHQTPTAPVRAGG